MTEPDTTALRALADRAEAAYNPARLDPATVRALCDGYDEAQRLREQVARVGSCAQCGGWWLDRPCGPTHAAVQAVAEHPVEVYAERDAARQALAEAEAEAARLRAEVVDLWECDGCGFAFPSEYHDADDPTSHTCPVCAEARLTDQRDAARQALADLVGELRGLAGHGRISGELLNAVIDPYDPDLFHCVHCEQYRDVEERHGGRDTDPGYYCDACVAGP